MKHFRFLLLAIALAPAAASGQALPDDPQPAPPSPAQASPPSQVRLTDAAWRRIQEIAHGEGIRVTNTYGPPLWCTFAGATDAYLFCDRPGNVDSAAYRFERASVVSVKVIRPAQNWHPGLLSAMIAGGLVVGIAATAQTDARHAAGAGLIGAMVAGAIAAPLVFLQPQPVYGGVGAALALHPHAFTHHPIFRFHPKPVLLADR